MTSSKYPHTDRIYRYITQCSRSDGVDNWVVLSSRMYKLTLCTRLSNRWMTTVLSYWARLQIHRPMMLQLAASLTNDHVTWVTGVNARLYCQFLLRDAMRSAVFAVGCSPSVRPSLSVTFVYCIQTAEEIVKLLSRPGSPTILVFWPRASDE